MKHIKIILAILFAAGLNSSWSQDTWTQKADFGGTQRNSAVGFSIGTKGYIGTGYDGSFYNDFWEYDPAANSWTQKANFGGTARASAFGFSIGSKGFIGTGYYYKNDFWEYDPVTNAWTQKSDFGGGARHQAIGFSIGSKGYIGTGLATDGYKKDFWEYNPATDTWIQKADFGGTAREGAVGFSIGSKGYIGTGYGYIVEYQNDFWEYDPSTNAWTQKADFEGTARHSAVGFSIGSKGYIGRGYSYDGSPHYYNDFWEYDPANNSWTQKADFGGTARSNAVGFSIGSKGYCGTGGIYPIYKKDFWEYTPDTSSCAVPANLSVTKITSSSAKLKWSAVEGAEGYGIRYKVAGISGWKYRTNYDNSKFIGGLSPNTEYKWQVRTYCDTLPPAVTSPWSSKQDFTTGSLRLSDESLQQTSFQLYPNPAEDHATIQFTLEQTSHVCIKVYDVSGKEIAAVLDAQLQQGNHSIPINTSHFSKGVYMVKMISPAVLRDGIQNQKLIVQ